MFARGIFGINTTSKLFFNFVRQDAPHLRTFSRVQENPIPPIDPKIFEDESFRLLVRLKTAFQELKDLDKQITEIKFNPTGLEIVTSIGSFQVQTTAGLATLFYTSPISGVYKYYYDVDAKRWVSNKDFHIFEENLTRETSKYFKAYLNI